MKHLSEAEIQDYALQKKECDTDIINHIAQCSECQKKILEYEQLFSAIKLLETATFDFDLLALVSDAIKPKPVPYSPAFYFCLLAFVGIALLLIAAYGLSLPGFDILSEPLIAVACISTILLVAAQHTDLYKNYQKAIGILNAQ